jgi:CheY-like chemotaxis protein
VACFFYHIATAYAMKALNKLAIKNILLAEDDDDDYLLFKDVLEESGIETPLVWVKDGVELLRYLRNKPRPDILFLDINMPRKNGFQCIDIIRNEIHLDLPIVIYSTSSDMESVKSMYFKRADMYICKPNSYQKLKQFIMHALSFNWSNNNARAQDFIQSDNHTLYAEFT